MGSALIVEFIGVPGAGKTTLMPVVSAHFNEQRYQAYSVLEAARPFAARTLAGRIVRRSVRGKLERFLLWQLFYALSYTHRLSFYRQHQDLMRSVLAYQKERPLSKNDRAHVQHWFLHQTGSYQFLKTYGQPGDVLIFDEGFIHRVVQLFASENERPDLVRVADYLDKTPIPDLVIYPNVPREVCEKRVYDRGIWDRFTVKTQEEINRYFSNAHTVVTFAVEQIKTKGWNVIEINNNMGSLPASKSVLRRNLSNLTVQFPERAYL